MIVRAAALGVVLAAAMALSSCAYYNTFYLARKNYDRGTGGLPYVPEKPDPGTTQNFNKAIEYSRKLIAQYPKDKLVDDAYLMWARALLGIEDPRQAVKLLEEFPAQFPQSALQHDARFYLGVAYRQSRKYGPALRSVDEYLAAAPRNHDLRPYALYERARVLMALERPGEAAEAAAAAIAQFPKFKLLDRVRVTRAEALLARGAHEEARQAFRDLGTRADSDEERLRFLLREADALEAAHRYQDELALLSDALAHEQAPARADTTGGRAPPPPVGADAYGRLLLRIGTTHLLAGRVEQALEAYRRVAQDFLRTPLGAEAQYRIGYAYETAADDFDRARSEYQRVREHGSGGSFLDQANLRLNNLERLVQFRSSGGDSAERKAEAGFLLAELYLFQLDKPERAIEEYKKIAREFDGTPMGAKAMNAEAWVLSRKLDRRPEADSLFWAVVREYPATEAQLAARDYLELAGVSVPENLIQMPPPQYARADTTRLPEVPAIPPAPTAIGPSIPAPSMAAADTLRPGRRPPAGFPAPFPRGGPAPPTASRPPVPLPGVPPSAVRAPGDTVRLPGPPARPDSANVSPIPPGAPRPTPPDSTQDEE